MANALKILKKILAVAAFLVVTLLAVILGVGLWVYFYPEQAWRVAEEKFLPDDLDIKWKTANLDVDHIKKMTWSFNFSFVDLSIEKKKPEISMKIDRVNAAAVATIWFPETSIRIQELVVDSASPLIIKTVPTPEKNKEPFDPTTTLKQITSLLEMLKQNQEYITVEKVKISVDDFRYISGEAEPIQAKFQLTKAEAKSNRITFSSKVRNLNVALPLIDLDGSVDLSQFNTSTAFLHSKIEFSGPKTKASIPLSFVYHSEQLKSDSEKIEMAYKLDSGWLKTNPVFHFLADKNKFSIQLVGDVTGIPGPIRNLQGLAINYKLPLDGGKNWLDSKGQVIVTAPIPLFFINKAMHAKIESSCKCNLVSTVEAKLVADIWLGRLFKPSNDPHPAIAAGLRIQSISNSIFLVDLGATLDVMRTEKAWQFNPTLDSKIHIMSFKSVREILSASRILVPAPLSVLDGKVNFTAKSPVLIHEVSGRYEGQAKISTDLKSPRQMAKMDAVLKIGISADLRTIEMDIESEVHDLRLELPPIDPVKGMPRVTRDSRIQLKPVVLSKRPAVKLLTTFKIQTTKRSAIRLFHPIAHPYIPISVNYGRDGADEKGAISIGAFKIKYLKREVNVDSLRLSLAETADADFPIDGRFHVNQTNYKVMIRVTGTTRKPYIDLSSDPYLGRADIVSVLLFDRTRENLAGGDAETSGNAEAAMADRAVGLFGLWAFASTPIRSVSYNSVTKVYSATVVLGKGLTAGVGTSLDEYTSLEIRKRLSKRWVIATTWAPAEGEESSGEVVLQWEKRY